MPSLSACVRSLAVSLCSYTLSSPTNASASLGLASRQHPVKLGVQEGVVDVAPWRDYARGAHLLESFVLPWETATISLHALLRAAFRQKTFPGLFPQVFCQVAAAVDKAIAKRCSGSADTAATICDGHWRRIGVELVRYQQAGLAAMQGKKYFSIAPDASRIGKRSYLLCPLVEAESGLAMWCAPQVVSGEMGRGLTKDSMFQEVRRNAFT